MGKPFRDTLAGFVISPRLVLSLLMEARQGKFVNNETLL